MYSNNIQSNCLKRSNFGPKKRWLLRQVTSFNSHEIFHDKTIQMWPFNTGDCKIEVTTCAGLTVMLCKNDMHSFCVLSICCVSSSLLQRYYLLVVTLQDCVFPSRHYINAFECNVSCIQKFDMLMFCVKFTSKVSTSKEPTYWILTI